MTDTDTLDQRIEAAAAVIDRFPSRSAAGRALGLSPSQISKALNPEVSSHGRLTTVEGAVARWQLAQQGAGRRDVPNRNNPERIADAVETYQRDRDPGLANRPLISDMFADSETRRPTKLEEQGLARIGGSVVAEGHDRDGIMYAVEVVFHVRLEPTVTTHKQTVTQGPSAGARP